MSQLYDIYQGDTFHLARSIVIKYDLVSEAINRELQSKGYQIVPDSPAGYKYYLNLSGEYHESDHDSLLEQFGSRHIMVDVATNTGYEAVPFTKELFHGTTTNRSLLNEYQLNSTFYNALIVKYPEFESLIRGILSPIDIDEAINAPDGAILSIAYQHRTTRDDGDVYYKVPSSLKNTKTSTLIETQEHNLITELQKWVTRTLKRWIVSGYSLTDDLYVPFVVGVLSAMLPSKIMNIRWSNVHTSYAHTFHIKEYLNSHGVLGKYVPYIPLKEVLYLYRNVRYLELNLGKTHTFEEIINNMLTPTSVPLAGYFFKHDISDMSDADGVLLPEGRMMREHLNFKSLGAGSDRRDIREVLDRQIPLARENYRYIDNVEEETRHDIRWSGDDELMVKVLESELTDIADPIPITLASQLIWFWAYTSSRDWYTGNIFVSNPVTDERIALTPLSAFILMIYCSNVAGRNQHLEFIPNDIVTAHWITKSSNPEYLPLEGNYEVRPSFEEVRKQSEVKHLTNDTLKRIMGDFEGEYVAGDSVDFFNMVKKHHDHLSTQFLDLCKIEDGMGHGYGEHAWYHMFWHDIGVKLTDDLTRYDEWLPRLGIDFGHFSTGDYNTLAIDLVTACTGLNDDADINRIELQRSMIEILQHFGSYTTHYLYSANQGNITNSHGKYPRVMGTEVDGDASLEEGVYIGLDVFNDKVEGVLSNSIPLSPLDVVETGIDDVVFDVVGDVRLSALASYMTFNNRMPMHQMDIISGRLSYDTTIPVKIPVPPSNTVLYDYSQYISSPYLLFDNAVLTVGVSDATGAVSDYPDVVEVVDVGGLLEVRGLIEEIESSTVHETQDTITTTGLTNVGGSSVIIENDAAYSNVDVVNSNLLQIGGGFERLDISNLNSAGTGDFIDITGNITESSELSGTIDTAQNEIVTVTGSASDEPNTGDGLIVGQITVTGDSYNEPEVVDNVQGTVETLDGIVRDDRDIDLVEEAILVESTDVSGDVTDILALANINANTQTEVTIVTGGVNDDGGIDVSDAVTVATTTIKGTVVDVLPPKRLQTFVNLTQIQVSGAAIDTTTQDGGSAAIFGNFINVTGESQDEHSFEDISKVSVGVAAVTGDVYDEVVQHYSDSLEGTIQLATGTGYDEYKNRYGESVVVNNITITDGGTKDDEELPTTASTVGTMVNVTGDLMDWVDKSTGDGVDISVVVVSGKVIDPVLTTDSIQTLSDDTTVSGYVADITILSSNISSTNTEVLDVGGEVSDHGSVFERDDNTITQVVITGVIEDDRTHNSTDAYWHRVSSVTGAVYDVIETQQYDELSSTVLTLTGEVSDLVTTYGFNTTQKEVTVDGKVVDGPNPAYGFSTAVNVVSVNGNLVDDAKIFNRDASVSETVDIAGNVYDNVVSSYVYKPINIDIVLITGVITDEDE